MTKKEFENRVNDFTYLVIDQVSNRFNFCGAVEIDDFINFIKDGTEYQLTGQLPEDVKSSIDTMIENDVIIDDFSGVVRFENDETTYYLLTW